MHAWLLVTDTELPVAVRSPGPGQTLVVHSDPQVSAETHICDRVRDCEYLVGQGKLTPDAAAPEKQLSRFFDSC